MENNTTVTPVIESAVKPIQHKTSKPTNNPFIPMLGKRLHDVELVSAEYMKILVGHRQSLLKEIHQQREYAVTDIINVRADLDKAIKELKQAMYAMLVVILVIAAIIVIIIK